MIAGGRARTEIPSLTGLRGLAALVVVVYHARTFSTPSLAAFPPAFARGYLAVDLFFILSGFVLAHVYGATFAERIGATDLMRFFRARIARIYPLHLVVLCLMLPLYGTTVEYGSRDFLYNLALLNGPWLDHQSWNRPAWSISAEFHAYLLFPFAVGAFLRWRAGLMLLATVAATVAVPLLMGTDTAVTGPLLLARSLPEFWLGVLLYRFWRDGRYPAILAGDGAAALIAVAIAGLAFAPGSDAAIVVLLAALLFACACNRGIARSVLEGRAFAFLGRISYALYITHWFAILLVVLWNPERISGWPLTMLMVAWSLAVGALLSRTIEYPARDLLRGTGARTAAARIS